MKKHLQVFRIGEETYQIDVTLMLLEYIRPTIDGTDMWVKKHAECHGNDFSILMTMELRSSPTKPLIFMPAFRGSFLAEAQTAARLAMTDDFAFPLRNGRNAQSERRKKNSNLGV